METNEDQPQIVAFVADLMFASKINNVAQHAGFKLRWIESADQLGEDSGSSALQPPGEQLSGIAGELFARLTAWQPALLLFDLDNSDIPWQRWIAQLKSSPATRRLPIIAYGPHVDKQRLNLARQAGADEVLPRSRFAADMPALLKKYARSGDSDSIQAACREPLTALAAKGVTLFNQGAYYQCHDDLEEAWRQDEGPGRDLYRAILQTGIAYYQIERNNYRGAVKMLLRVRQWLHPLPDYCRTVHVARLREDVANVYEALIVAGPEHLAQVDRSLFRPIELQD